MKLETFMEMYDNWNGLTKINDDDLNPIFFGKTIDLMEKRTDLLEKEVVVFGFYDNELCVRVK